MLAIMKILGFRPFDPALDGEKPPPGWNGKARPVSSPYKPNNVAGWVDIKEKETGEVMAQAQVFKHTGGNVASFEADVRDPHAETRNLGEKVGLTGRETGELLTSNPALTNMELAAEVKRRKAAGHKLPVIAKATGYSLETIKKYSAALARAEK